MYIYIDKDGFLNHFPMKPVVCQPLSKFGIFTCVYLTYNILHRIFSIKGRVGDQNFRFLVDNQTSWELWQEFVVMDLMAALTKFKHIIKNKTETLKNLET